MSASIEQQPDSTGRPDPLRTLVASIGGFVKQYQANLDPNKLAAYDMSVKDVVHAIKASNNDVEGRVLESRDENT